MCQKIERPAGAAWRFLRLQVAIKELVTAELRNARDEPALLLVVKVVGRVPKGKGRQQTNPGYAKHGSSSNAE
jgi:hypothetical protein